MNPWIIAGAIAVAAVICAARPLFRWADRHIITLVAAALDGPGLDWDLDDELDALTGGHA